MGYFSGVSAGDDDVALCEERMMDENSGRERRR